MSGSAHGAVEESVPDSSGTKRPSQPPAQTLVRGLAVLRTVAEFPQGVTVTEIAQRTGLHRTVVHRLVNTLATEGFVARTADGSYAPGRELRVLANRAKPTLVEFIQPSLQLLADRYGGTAILAFAEPDSILAVATATPLNADYHLAYRKGSRHPLDRGAAPDAIRAGRAAAEDDPPEVRQTRRRGWTVSHGAVEPGAHAVAAPLARNGDAPEACVMFVSHRSDSIAEATPEVVAVAERARAFHLGSEE
ncbi:IclR family transcriptional regulator [Streptomyces sp. NPDC058045]|uniref:IclR family transcriptional regulator n=1 Tax=Streptomyces sp. NPDC058045 TaxID=3346311 RepID=UPI0036E32531